jgi:hypothetical protein
VRPVVFEQVAVDETRRAFLSSNRFLTVPLDALERGVPLLPAKRLGEMVVDDLDVGGHESGYRRIGAAEHDVFAGRLEIVIGDPERPGAVPAADRLRIGANFLEVGQVRIDDRRLPRIDRDSPRRAPFFGSPWM